MSAVVYVAGQTMELEVPPRICVRHDLSIASGESRKGQTGVRVCAAALLMCWPGLASKKDAPRYRGDVIDFGGDALDYLLGVGATLADIVAAGNVALEMVISSLVTARQVEEARGNSGAPTGG